jgi:hypothetical protein
MGTINRDVNMDGAMISRIKEVVREYGFEVTNLNIDFATETAHTFGQRQPVVISREVNVTFELIGTPNDKTTEALYSDSTLSSVSERGVVQRGKGRRWIRR